LILRDFFGERGGTRTLDPMIKSHVLNANQKFCRPASIASWIDCSPTNRCCWRKADISKHDL
jgi:hypothetical protein